MRLINFKAKLFFSCDYISSRIVLSQTQSISRPLLLVSCCFLVELDFLHENWQLASDRHSALFLVVSQTEQNEYNLPRIMWERRRRLFKDQKPIMPNLLLRLRCAGGGGESESVWQPDSASAQVNQDQLCIYQGQSVKHELTSHLLSNYYQMIGSFFVYLTQYLKSSNRNREITVAVNNNTTVLMLDCIRIIILNDDDVLLQWPGPCWIKTS